MTGEEDLCDPSGRDVDSDETLVLPVKVNGVTGPV